MDLILIFILIGAGLLAGFMSGLLGVGGGFVFAPAMYFVLKLSGVSGETAILIAFGTSLAAAFPTIMTTAIGHLKKGNVVRRNAVIMGVCGIVTGFIGGTAATYLPVKILEILFGLLMAVAAVKLITTLPSGNKESMPVPMCCGIGGTAGFFSGLLGLGGGTILVPLMMFLGKFNIKKAVGTSAAAIVFITLGGIASYLVNGFTAGISLDGFLLVGYIDVIMWAIMVASAIPMAILAIKLGGKFSEKKLKILFFVLMIIIALKMLGVFDLIGGIITV
ncbi:MAG: sulfite exporter TauE/SafE family protein [Methanocorpusculum sp.]|nr:sulfite exporter TauE/SafE family protein [Methanocorpusculum sp.]